MATQYVETAPRPAPVDLSRTHVLDAWNYGVFKANVTGNDWVRDSIGLDSVFQVILLPSLQMFLSPPVETQPVLGATTTVPETAPAPSLKDSIAQIMQYDATSAPTIEMIPVPDGTSEVSIKGMKFKVDLNKFASLPPEIKALPAVKLFETAMTGAWLITGKKYFKGDLVIHDLRLHTPPNEKQLKVKDVQVDAVREDINRNSDPWKIVFSGTLSAIPIHRIMQTSLESIINPSGKPKAKQVDALEALFYLQDGIPAMSLDVKSSPIATPPAAAATRILSE